MPKVTELYVDIGSRTKGLERGLSNAEKAMKRVGQRMSKIGSSMTKGITLPLLALGGASVKAFADFDKAMTESLAIMGDVSKTMRDDMAKMARQMSEETTFAASELAEAYFFLASAGMSAADSIKALPVVAKFAQAGAFDLATATDLLTDAQTAMGLAVGTAEEKQRNLIKVSNILVKANTLANASVLQFSEALTNRAAAALVNVNKGMEEGVAVLAAFADKGVKGQLAGTQLAMMLNALDMAARKSSEAWEEHGIKLFDAQGEMLKTGDLIASLENLLGPMTTELRSATLAQLGFTVRTKASILTLLGSSEKIKQVTKDLTGLKDTTEEISKKQLETFANQMKIIRNRLVNTGIALGEQLAPALLDVIKAGEPLLEMLTGLIKGFSKLPGVVKTTAIAFGGLAAAMGPVLFMSGKILTAFPGMSKVIKAAGFSMATLRGTTATLGSSLKILPALGAAAFVGWGVGRLLSKVLGLEKGILKLMKSQFDADITSANSIKYQQLLRTAIEGTDLSVFKLKQEYGSYKDALEAVLSGENQTIENKIKTAEKTRTLTEATKDLSSETLTTAGAYEKLATAVKKVTDARHEELRLQQLESVASQELAEVEGERASDSVKSSEDIVGGILKNLGGIESLKVGIGDLTIADLEATRVAQEAAEARMQAIGRTLEMISSIASGVSNIISGLFENTMMRIDNEEQARRDAIEGSMMSEASKAKAIEKLDKDIEQKRRTALRKRAAAEKATALMSAIVNTARAIVEALPNLVLAGIAGALGLAQIAVIAGTPVPGGKEGGIFTKPTIIEVGEGAGRAPEVLLPLDRLTGIFRKTMEGLPKQATTTTEAGRPKANITIAPVIQISTMDALGVRDFMRTKGIQEIVAALKTGIQKPEFRDALGVET